MKYSDDTLAGFSTSTFVKPASNALSGYITE